MEITHSWKAKFMKIKFLISVVLISLITDVSLTTLAQTPVQAPIHRNELAANPKESEKINNIEKLLEITGARNMTQQILTQMLNSIKSEEPQVPTKFWDTFAAELNPDEMINEYIPLYDKYFTNEEIKEIIGFYETPIGQKTSAVTPQIT